MTYAISTRLASSWIGLATAAFVTLGGSMSAFAQDAVVATLPQDIHFEGAAGAVGIATLYGDPKKAGLLSERLQFLGPAFGPRTMVANFIECIHCGSHRADGDCGK